MRKIFVRFFDAFLKHLIMFQTKLQNKSLVLLQQVKGMKTLDK